MPDEPIAPVPAVPTVEKLTETKETTKTTGNVVALQAVPPAPVADDAIRRELARYVIFADSLTCAFVIFLLFRFGPTLPQSVMTIVATIIGTIIGYRSRDTGTVIGYLFGGSSGLTAKSASLDKS